MTERSGIYVIKHAATGRVYVGSATNISKRWSRHRKELRLGTHRNAHLQAAWAKYGEQAFLFYIVEFTDDLTAREQFWIDELDAFGKGFNLCPVARSSRGRRWSPEERRRRLGSRNWGAHLNTPEALAKRKGTAAINGARCSKLTLDQAREIRQRYGELTGNRRPHARTSGRPTLAQLGREYGLSVGQMSALVNGRTYREEVMPR